MVEKNIVQRYIVELNNLINYVVEDTNMKKELSKMLSNDFYEDNKFQNTYNMYARIIAWLLMIISMKNYKISNLNWNLICILHNSNLYEILSENERYYKQHVSISPYQAYNSFKERNIALGWRDFYSILHKFYLCLYDGVIYIDLLNINEINEYKHLLINHSKVDVLAYKSYGNFKELSINILNNFQLNSNYNEIIQIEYFTDDSKKTISIANLNIRTDNKFIKNLLSDFILTYGGKIRPVLKYMRIFGYYFVESLSGSQIIEYKDFNEEVFKVQYKFYLCIARKCAEQNIKVETNRTTLILVAFYRNMISNFEKLNTVNNFSLAFKQSIYLKNFYQFYEKEFIFVYHNRFESPPKSDKYCILPSNISLLNTNVNNCKLVSVNLEEVPKRYRDDVRNFIWKFHGNTRSLYNYMYKLVEFLNFKINHNKLYVNMFEGSTDLYKEFSKDLLWDYRNTIELNIGSSSHIKSILKIVRKFLKYFKDKYNVTKSDLDILNLKGLEKFDGGKPITDNDAIIIYQKFEKRELEVPNGRLFTIAFELYMLTNLRSGEILNLKRDCLDKNKNTIELRYLSKTSNQEVITQSVSKNIAALIDEAISLTKPYVVEEDLMSQFIFIEPYNAKHVDKSKRINFYQYFKTIIKSVEDKLEIKDYTPYNIRDTFINTVYKQGTKNNISIQKMANITGNSYKTANLYYRKSSDIQLYVEAMAKVIISDVDIHGNILEVEENKYRIVKKDLGRCKNEHCVFDIAECLMCKSFITFVNRIPYFEQQIIEYNIIIERSLNPMEIEELNIQKKLLGKFLLEMYKIQQLKG